jgi:presequence protease
LNSYRDPNLVSTLENYANTAGYLDGFSADPKLMTRYIIGTISEIDSPLTPSQKGDQAVSNFFSGRSAVDVQTDREKVLSTTPGDIRAFAPMVSDVLNQDALCVYGNAEVLSANQSLFANLVKL